MGTPRTRRKEAVNTFENVGRLLSGSSVQSQWVDKINLYDYGLCEDELNEMPLLGKTNYDVGGPLLSVQAKHNFPSYFNSYVRGDAFGLTWDHTGPFIAYPVYVLGGPTPESSWRFDSNLDSLFARIGMGATAISRCKPAAPHASLTTSVVELVREGIPNTLRQFTHLKEEVRNFRGLTRAQKGKTIPSKYLEYQFGWKPLVSDIRKASSALLEADAILEDLRRNSGKRMRRRYTFPDVVDTVEYQRDNIYPWPSPNIYVLGQSGNRVITKIDTKRTWFSGEFIYHYPSADAAIPSRMIRGARTLLGADLTPETIWNVAPWTWLADWFANVGDIASNFTAFGADDLVMRYGYLMQEAKRVWRHEHFGVFLNSAPGNKLTMRGESVFTARSRIVATPFGFGLTWDELSPRQIAILASIGITRRGRH